MELVGSDTLRTHFAILVASYLLYVHLCLFREDFEGHLSQSMLIGKEGLHIFVGTLRTLLLSVTIICWWREKEN